MFRQRKIESNSPARASAIAKNKSKAMTMGLRIELMA
jgi:hypothetical protein